MLDQILSTIKGELAPKLEEMGLPTGKSEEAIGLAKDDILDVFQKETTDGNMSGILNLFNGKQDIGSSSIVKNVVSNFGGSLISKLDINPSVANSIAQFAIPFIMSKVNSSTPSEGIDKGDLTKMIGGSVMDKLGGGLKDTLGGFFN